jgi:hypothetical protein
MPSKRRANITPEVNHGLVRILKQDGVNMNAL